MSGLELSLGTLALIKHTDLVTRAVQSNDSKKLRNVVKELKSSQDMLLESKFMIERIDSPPPSIFDALQKCQQANKQLETFLQCTGLDGEHDSRKRVRTAFNLRMRKEKIAQTVAELKETSSLLHRETCAVTRSTQPSDPVPNSRTVPQADTQASANNTKTNANASGDLTRSTPPPGQRSLTRVQTVREQTTPLEMATMFYATISFIADTLPQGPSNLLTDDARFGTTCCCDHRRRGYWFSVSGKFDTGCKHNLVSMNVIERAGLQNFLVKDRTGICLRGLKENTVLDHKIQLNWQLNDHANSYTSEFWVADTENFDILVGELWMLDHGYDITFKHDSRKQSSFFGGLFSSILFPPRSKEQSQREREKADDRNLDACNTVRQNRGAALMLQPLVNQTNTQGSLANRGVFQTGLATSSTGIGSQFPSAITPMSNTRSSSHPPIESQFTSSSVHNTPPNLHPRVTAPTSQSKHASTLIPPTNTQTATSTIPSSRPTSIAGSQTASRSQSAASSATSFTGIHERPKHSISQSMDKLSIDPRQIRPPQRANTHPVSPS